MLTAKPPESSPSHRTPLDSSLQPLQEEWCINVVQRATRSSPRFEAVALHVFSGVAIDEVARRLNRTEAYVRKWCDRYQRLGPKGLEDRARSGRPRKLSDDAAAAQLMACLRRHLTQPSKDCVTTRSLAKELNVSQPTVSRLLRRLGLNTQVRATLPGLEFAADRAGELIAVLIHPRAQLLALALDELPAVLQPGDGVRLTPNTGSSGHGAKGAGAPELGDVRAALAQRWPWRPTATPRRGPPPPWASLWAQLAEASQDLPVGRRLHLIVGGRLPNPPALDGAIHDGVIRRHATLSLKLWRDQLARTLESLVLTPAVGGVEAARSFVQTLVATPAPADGEGECLVWFWEGRA